MANLEIGLTIAGTYVTVSGDYSPPEQMIMYYPDGGGYPGYPAEFELESVQVDGTEIIDLLSEEIIDEIIEKVIENQN